MIRHSIPLYRSGVSYTVSPPFPPPTPSRMYAPCFVPRAPRYAQATLLLNRADPSYFTAYQFLTQMFDGIFYNKNGGCGVNNTAQP